MRKTNYDTTEKINTKTTKREKNRSKGIFKNNKSNYNTIKN